MYRVKITCCFIIAVIIFYNSQGQNTSQSGVRSKGVVPVNPVPTNVDNGTKYALIVGVSHYQDAKIPPLCYAHTDAQNFYNLIKSGYMGAFKSENVKYYIETKAVWDSVMSFVFWFNRLKVKAGDEIFVFFSGHGGVYVDKQTLICQNSSFVAAGLGDLQSSIYLSQLKDAVTRLTQSGAKVFFIVDACRNSFIPTPVNYDAREDEHRSGDGEIMMFACHPNESSYESKYLNGGNGIFSYFVVQGLLGAASFGNSNTITLGDLQTYVTSRVRDYAKNVLGQLQKPVIEFDDKNDKIVLSKLPSIIRKQSIERDLKLQKTMPKTSAQNVTSAIYASKGLKSGVYVMRTKSIDEKSDTSRIVPANIPSTNPGEVSDSAELLLYNTINQKILNNKLIRPRGSSAYDYFYQMRNKFPESRFLNEEVEKLFVALLRNAQSFLDNYLAGTLLSPKKEAFDLAYEEFQCSLNIAPDSSIFKSDFSTKMTFIRFLSLAFSDNPKDWSQGLMTLDTSSHIPLTGPLLHYIRGLFYYDDNKFYSAIQELDTTTKYIPNWPYAMTILAKCYFNVEEYGKSVKECQDIIMANSKYAEAYSIMAVNYENINLLDSAVYWNRIALTIDSTIYQPYLYLGRVYFKLARKDNNYKTLSNYYLNTGGYRYSNFECLNYLGLIEQTKSNFDSAKFYYLKSLEMNPYNANGISLLADLYNILGEPTEADSLYAHAIYEQGKNTKLYSRYMNFIFRNRSDSIADLIFKKILSFNKEDPSVYLDYSKQLDELGYTARAKDVLLLGLKNIGPSSSLFYGLSQFYFKHYTGSNNQPHSLDSARKYLNLMRGMDSTSSLANFGLYQLFLIRNRTDSALYHLELSKAENRYIQLTNNFNKDLFEYGNVQFKRKNYDSAITFYKSAIRLSQERYDVVLLIARAYYLNKQLDSALIYCKEAEKLCDNNPDLIRTIRLEGLIQIDNQNYVSARDVFDLLTRTYKDTAHLFEEAVYDFAANQLSDAFSLANFLLRNDTARFQKIINLEGADYSSIFILTAIEFANKFDALQIATSKPFPLSGLQHNKEYILNKIKDLLSVVGIGSPIDSVISYEYGKKYTGSLSYDSLSIASECSKGDIKYFWKYISQSKFRTALQYFFNSDYLSFGATQESYIAYFFRNNRLIAIELRLGYNNTLTYKKIQDILGIKRSDDSQQFFDADNIFFGSVHLSKRYGAISIALGNANESKSCSVDWR